jgi:NAD(P)-dependent dehydrogenase (short-subunit alcohol dehydrogenase family)
MAPSNSPRVALITGAASGMGRLAAQRLGRGGCRVAALDVNEVGLAETAHASANIHRFVVDVTDSKEVEQVVERVEAELGPIDRVHNAAAIMPTGFLLDQDSALIQKIMDINYGGTVNVCQAVMPRLLSRGRGDLVNFASVAGWIPVPHFGAYNASKFAVVAYTEVLYHENRGRGVRFACVCPPPVATPLLQQAKSKPKTLDTMPPIPPEKVLDAIERGLERGRLMVYPDFSSALVVRLRRLIPGIVWASVRRIEGL